jgi:hypothetical protein
MSVLCLSAAAWARDMGPPVRWLAFRDVGGSVEGRYESEERDRETKSTGTGVFFSDRRLHEILTLETEGYVYHPRFLDWRAAVGIDLEQARVDVKSPTIDRSTRESLSSPLYRISGIFLSRHPTSVSFALDRIRTTSVRGFGDLVITDASSEQATAHFKGATMPGEVFFSHAVTDEDERGFGEDRHDEDTRLGFNFNHYAGPSTSRISYEYRDNTEEIVPQSGPGGAIEGNEILIERRIHDLSFSNNYRFGPKSVDSLDSTLIYRDESGSFPLERYGLTEALHLQHRPTLWSDYGLQLSRETIQGTQLDTMGANASLSHQLYESLLSTVEAHASREDLSDITRDEYGGGLNFNYRKQVPHGTLFVDLGAGQDFTSETGGMTVVPVVDERHVLSATSVTTLDNPDVVGGSVTVTNAAGTTTFLAGADYRVRQRGDRTELRRVASGSIPSCSTVLVDYSFELDEPLEFTTTRTQAGARLDLFRLWSLYVRRHTTTNDVTSGAEMGRLQDIYDTVYGTELRVEPLTLRAEHQDYDSTDAPFTADTLSADLRHTFARVHTISGLALWRRVRFEEGEDLGAPIAADDDDAADETDISTTRSASLAYQIAGGRWPSWPSIRAEVGVEEEDDRGFSERYTFTRLEASYTVRATEFVFTYWWNDRDDDFVLETEQYFLFSVRRSF